MIKKILLLSANPTNTSNTISLLGKPEPLKHELAGFCSRLINEENRLVYTINDTEIIIAACKYHYEE